MLLFIYLILLLSHFSNLIIWYTIRKKEDII